MKKLNSLFLEKQDPFRFTSIIVLLLCVNFIKGQTVPATFTTNNVTVTNVLTSSGQLNADGILATDTIKATDDVMIKQNLHVDGNILLNGNLNTPNTSTATLGSLIANSDAIFNSSLKISNFTSTGPSKVYVDANGFLQKGGPIVGAGIWECIQTSPNWNLGGNNAIGFVTGPNPLSTYADIGTCDGVDFVLKANSIQRQWIKVDGKIGFGIQNPGSTAGPEYQFHQGVLRLSGGNTFGGPQVIFDGGSPNGDWGIEYINAAASPFPGLNFWKPSGSANSFNFLFFIGDDGRMTVGDVNEAASARFNVDGWNGNGIRAKVNATAKAYSVINKNTGVEDFVVFGDGRTYIGIQRPILTGPHASAKLAVDGKILAKEIYVNIHNSVWADYVFDKNYKLMPLNEVEAYVTKNKHLPNVPSTKDLTETDDYNLSLSEMQKIQMEKIEELYLHVINQQKEIEILKQENQELKKAIKK